MIDSGNLLTFKDTRFMYPLSPRKAIHDPSGQMTNFSRLFSALPIKAELI